MNTSTINSTGYTSRLSDINVINEKTRSIRKQQSSSSSSTDTVSISSEAMEKYLAMSKAAKQEKNTDVASQVTAWYDNFRGSMGMASEPDYSTWPKENLARRERLIAERDALAPSCSNTSFTESNRKMNGIQDQLMALDIVGGQQVLSDRDMDVALNALHSAMDRWENDAPGTSASLAGNVSVSSGAMEKTKSSAELSFRLSQKYLLDSLLNNKTTFKDENEVTPIARNL